MSENILIEGWLREERVENGEYHEALVVDDDSPQRDQPLAERFEDLRRKQVTIRYWVCGQKCTQDEATDYFLRSVMGFCEADFGARYSELTGYLWTDEYLKVGGHDIIEELRSNVGKWLILEIEVH